MKQPTIALLTSTRNVRGRGTYHGLLALLGWAGLIGSVGLVGSFVGCSFNSAGTAGDAAKPDAKSVDASIVDADPLVPDAPRAAWWDSAFGFRRQITITAGASDVPSGASLVVDTATAPLRAMNKVRLDAKDWRVVRQVPGFPAVELDRWIDDGEGAWNSGKTLTWFKSNTALAAGLVDGNTWIYYGNVSPTTEPPAALDRVFVYGQTFDAGAADWQNNGVNGEAIATKTSNQRAGAGYLEIKPGNGGQCGGLHRDMTLPNVPLLFSHYLKQENTGSSLGSVRTFSELFNDRNNPLDWFDASLVGFIELDSANFVQINHRGGTLNWFPQFGTNWRRVEVVHDLPRHKIKARIDGGTWSDEYDTRGADTAAVASIAIEGERQGGTFGVDNFMIRRYVTVEPTVTVGPEQTP